MGSNNSISSVAKLTACFVHHERVVMSGINLKYMVQATADITEYGQEHKVHNRMGKYSSEIG